MKRTRVCDLLGIQYPILQGGMLWLADAELAAAVSNAGALGVISPYAGMEKHGDGSTNLEEQLKRIRDLTEKPFGVNIPLDLDQSGLLIDVLLQQGVEIAITAAGSPALYTELLRQSGMKVFHVISSVSQGRFAESCGVDGVISEGIEAAAHNGLDELPLFSLIPQVVESLSIPVIAAGGIVDARGVVAAMTLGAEGVQLGTRFVAVDENPAHPNYKRAILEAEDTDTVITCRSLLPTRSLKAGFSARLLELEQSGASAEDLRDFLGYRRARKGQLEGDLDQGETFAGSSAGLIKEIVPAAKVVQDLVEGYEKVIKHLINS
ncbi:MAG: nitronate monooxygenase [Desulfobacteraceae bacterium]|nr:nitronate monooxygenase [Desulfobacteraceae bacterium]